jgi:hypothetical protein
MDVANAVKAAKGGAVEFRVEKAGIVHAGVGKASFTEEQIAGNVKAFVDAVIKAKPQGAKGTFVKKVSISSTMGPGLKLDLASVTGAGGIASVCLSPEKQKGFSGVIICPRLQARRKTPLKPKSLHEMGVKGSRAFQSLRSV